MRTLRNHRDRWKRGVDRGLVKSASNRHVGSAIAYAASSAIVTDVIATGESGRSRLFRGALTILSTTSMPFVTWPKIT